VPCALPAAIQRPVYNWFNIKLSRNNGLMLNHFAGQGLTLYKKRFNIKLSWWEWFNVKP